MGCCTCDSCHIFPLLFSVITSFILSQYADWYQTVLGVVPQVYRIEPLKIIGREVIPATASL